ncbi:hypothetical protein [Streptomyces sp. NBC_01198]|uniref:hypothetical protein n=1 Tax=Streptomyces sp. NBC_01198 TaxID=2903769 RepID=UPI002E10F92B|nr:hypothetical protein OG702_34960 [Streptomyces sp. NBC_01198]
MSSDGVLADRPEAGVSQDVAAADRGTSGVTFPVRAGSVGAAAHTGRAAGTPRPLLAVAMTRVTVLLLRLRRRRG